MPKTEVILLQPVTGLGAETDQVKVAAGYARNYLIPQRLAMPLSAANKRYLDKLRQRRAEREAQELNAMNELASSIGKLVCKITVKTGEDGKMFGSVTSGTIADELKNQFAIALDRKKIHLEAPLRSLGEHEVELRLHPQVNARLKVLIASSTPLPTPEELAAAAAASLPAGRRGKSPARAADAPAQTKPPGAESKPAGAPSPQGKSRRGDKKAR